MPTVTFQKGDSSLLNGFLSSVLDSTLLWTGCQGDLQYPA